MSLSRDAVARPVRNGFEVIRWIATNLPHVHGFEVFASHRRLTGFQGQAQAFQSSTQGLGMLLVLAILVVYIVLGILYESFFHPLTMSETFASTTTCPLKSRVSGFSA